MKRQTKVSIQGSAWLINGVPTYEGRTWKHISIEGLLMNSRMVQAVFDDRNPETAGRWRYPDTEVWDCERNTNEFLDNMQSWREHGVLALTINLQGGSPEGYSRLQPWINSAFHPDGTLDEAYMNRLERILDRADELGMVIILGYFYFGQDLVLASEYAVKQAVVNATMWVHQKGYTNVVIEIANECDILYRHPIILMPRIHELIELARLVSQSQSPGAPLLIGASCSGGTVPANHLLEVSDFVLLHGNSCSMEWISRQIDLTRSQTGYRGQPIVNNEDDHFDFDQDRNHLLISIERSVSWGYFDPGQSDYEDGYQCPPVNWGINTARKKQFFEKIKEITGH
ncbi:hypothetical protein [Paenibacillus algicola]|uniref:hypothetical protein n=1 Tax=Paenibacillus algicola TaxID=2565926 RepID=UPI001C30B8C0|nr:hypothetical protein [Paenibacillus algicola]